MRGRHDLHLILAAAFLRSTATLAVPIWIGASMKIAYDVMLYAAFRNLRPPEELRGTPSPS